MAPNPFKKATKQQLKARLALAGPTGSGKTWTALEWAQVLGQKVAVIDTERGSAALYADQFGFDTLAMSPPYEPATCVKYLRAAEANGYDVVVIDSLTHFWQGEGGTLDMVDAAANRMGGNKYAGWSVGTPALRNLVDTILGVDMHVIVTMRSKMDYVEVEVVENGKKRKKYERVGMAPIMRDGIEYEFTLMGDLDLEHRIIISKSRCSELADTLVQPGRAGEAAEAFLKWLETGVEVVQSGPAKTKLIEACGGDKDRAIELWNEFFDGYRAVPTMELDALLEQARAMTKAETSKTSTPDGSGHQTAGDPAPDPVLAQDGGQREVPPAEPPAANDTSDDDAPAYTADDLDRFLTASGYPPGKAMLKAKRIAGSLDVPCPASLDAIEAGVLLDALLASLKSDAPQASDFVPMDQVQNRRVHALISKARPGQDRHQVMSELLGRPVESAKELSTDDAQRIADALDAEVKTARGAAS